MRPQIIRPQDNPEHAFPKAQVQESDGVEPGGAPYPGGERMLLDAYLDFSTPEIVFGCHAFFLKRSPFYVRPKMYYIAKKQALSPETSDT